MRWSDAGAMMKRFECAVGAWLSLVERLVRDQEVGGSNPLAPTKSPPKKKTAPIRKLSGAP